MKESEIYKVIGAHDMDSKKYVVGYYDNYNAAYSDASDVGGWGSRGTVESVAVLTFTHDGEEYTFLKESRIKPLSQNKEERAEREKLLRQSGISKLTKEEREALGL